MRPSHVLCFLALTLAASAAPAPNADKVDEHLRRVMKFVCGKPQERAVPAGNVVKRQLHTNQTLWPSVTVVKLCEASSGCCLGQAGRVCSPIAYENVTLYFKLQSPPAEGSPHGSHEVIHETVEQHKTCGCRSVVERNEAH